VDYAVADRREESLIGLRGRYTIVMVSPSLSQALWLAGRLLVLRDRELVCSLGCDEINRVHRRERSIDDIYS